MSLHLVLMLVFQVFHFSWHRLFGGVLVRYFVKYPPKFGSVWCFIMIRLVLWFFWKSITEVKCPSHPSREYTMSTWLTHSDANLDHLVKVMSTRFLYRNPTSFSLLYSNYWQWVIESNLFSRGTKLNSTFWKKDYLSTCYWDFFCRDLSLFTYLPICLFMYLINYVFISVLTQGYLFYLFFGYNNTLVVNFDVQIIIPVANRNSPLDMILFFLILKFLSTSLFGTRRCHTFLLYCLCPGSRISIFPRRNQSFYGRVIFRKQDLGPGCAHCYWGNCIKSLSVHSVRKYVIYINIYSYIYISLFTNLFTGMLK